jgi:hypothetical protein
MRRNPVISITYVSPGCSSSDYSVEEMQEKRDNEKKFLDFFGESRESVLVLEKFLRVYYIVRRRMADHECRIS